MPPRKAAAQTPLSLRVREGSFLDNPAQRAWDKILNPFHYRVNAAAMIAEALQYKGREASGIAGPLLTAADRRRLRNRAQLAFDWNPGSTGHLAAVKEAYQVGKDGKLTRQVAKRRPKQKPLTSRVQPPVEPDVVRLR